MSKDNIGQTIKDLPGPSPWSEQPPSRLFARPNIDVDKLATGVQHSLNKDYDGKDGNEVEIRVHPNAGNVLCGFISYESFAQAFIHSYILSRSWLERRTGVADRMRFCEFLD
jgi:hypothetical protein